MQKLQSRRVLFVHAGGGKTGSSALQSAFAAMAPQLAKTGISYTNAPATESRYAITSGNGTLLFDLIASSRWDSEGPLLLEKLLGTDALGICSCEFLGSMSTGNWRRLLATAERCEIQIRVIFFVRSAGEYITSCYNQDVKRGGVSASLDEYIVDAPWHHLDALMTLDSVIPPEALRVLNYEACRSNLADAFAGAFPELAVAGKVLRGAAKRKVNRSLDASEISVVRLVNRQIGAKAGETLSDKLIYAAPERSGGIGLSNAQAATVAEKFADGTSWINQRFFSGAAEQLSLVSGGSEPEPSKDNDEVRALRLALNWSAEELGKQVTDDRSSIRQALLKIDWQNASLPDIPIDFDPIAYLIFNEDVVNAGVSPYFHYNNSGKSENRTYQWPPPVDAQYDAAMPNAADSLQQDDGASKPGEPPRHLRYHYQIEGLLHGFAAREREYLDQIRKLSERRGFDRAETREELGRILPIIRQDLVSARQEDSDRINTALANFETALSQNHVSVLNFARTAHDHYAEIGIKWDDFTQASLQKHAEMCLEMNAIRSDQAQLGNQLSETESKTVEGLQAFRIEQVRFNSKLAETNAKVFDELLALRAQHDRLNDQLIEKDVELARERETISRYREAGWLGFFNWGIRRSLRP